MGLATVRYVIFTEQLEFFVRVILSALAEPGWLQDLGLDPDCDSLTDQA